MLISGILLHHKRVEVHLVHEAVIGAEVPNDSVQDDSTVEYKRAQLRVRGKILQFQPLGFEFLHECWNIRAFLLQRVREGRHRRRLRRGEEARSSRGRCDRTSRAR